MNDNNTIDDVNAETVILPTSHTSRIIAAAVAVGIVVVLLLCL